jgi:hypothetical protein
MTWTTVAPHAKDSHGDDGGLTEAIAPAHGDNAKDSYRQVGEANLELEGITNRPADGLRDRIRNEEMTENPQLRAPPARLARGLDGRTDCPETTSVPQLHSGT